MHTQPIKLFLVLMMVYSPITLFANEVLTVSQLSGKLITSVVVTGNSKTRTDVIHRELDFTQGDTFSEASIKRSEQKLKNLRIFEDVSIQYHPGPDQGVQVQVNASDRWTVIPIAKITGGGGSRLFTVGVYDVNSFGKFLEVGAQYQNLNGKNGGVLWFRNPRLLNTRLLFGMDIWHFRQTQPFYKEDGNILGAFNNTKNRFHLFLKNEITPWFFFGGGLDIVSDEFDDTGLTDEQRLANSDNLFVAPGNAEQNFVELNLQLGELNYDRYMIEGLQLNLDSRFTNKTLASADNSAEYIAKAIYFKKFKHQQNIGINVVVGHTTSSLIQNQFFLGGLFEVRGYVDRRFQGSDYWRSNIEYRVPSYRSRWFVLQHVAFMDVGRIGNSIDQTFTSESDAFSSVGTGLRFISPKIYRFNARLDFAKTFGTESNLDISFGLQQFF